MKGCISISTIVVLVVLSCSLCNVQAFTTPRSNCGILIQEKINAGSNTLRQNRSYVQDVNYNSRNNNDLTSLFARRKLLSEDNLAAPPDPKVIEAVQSLGGNDVLASGESFYQIELNSFQKLCLLLLFFP